MGIPRRGARAEGEAGGGALKRSLGVTNGLCEHSRAWEHCDFFATTSRDEKFALRAAKSLESTTRRQQALLIFSACSNPYRNPFL